MGSFDRLTSILYMYRGGDDSTNFPGGAARGLHEFQSSYGDSAVADGNTARDTPCCGPKNRKIEQKRS